MQQLNWNATKEQDDIRIVESNDDSREFSDAINYSLLVRPNIVRTDVKGLVRHVFQDGRCMLQLSARSAKEVGQETAVVRPERLWREKSNANFITRFPQFRRERNVIMSKLGEYLQIIDPKRRRYSKKQCFNSGRIQ